MQFGYKYFQPYIARRYIDSNIVLFNGSNSIIYIMLKKIELINSDTLYELPS